MKIDLTKEELDMVKGALVLQESSFIRRSNEKAIQQIIGDSYKKLANECRALAVKLMAVS